MALKNVWLRNTNRLSTSSYRSLFSSPQRRDAPDSTESADTRVRDWISKIMSKTHVQDDVIDPHKLQLLDLTLPVFDAKRKAVSRPELNTPIIPGTELTFFPPLAPTEALFADGTDPSYSAPSPFFRRMWAGGEFAFDSHNPLRVGQKLRCETTVEDVKLKGWEKARETGSLDKDTMIFVKQRREVSNEHGFAVVERRTHVYRPELVELPPSAEATGKKKIAYHSDQLPPDEQFTFTPSAHTLFRFSALTFNAHRIHLDPIYSSQQEGHEDRLVHGPMTALLLLRFAHFKKPSEKHIAAFKYRATHPLVVDRPLTLNLAWTSERRAAEVWATNQDGIIGMRGSIVFT
ncbi:putative hydroxyacyl-thioester dehydratase type 2 [Rhizoctonia solani 123E]|nr:putative hydroxyacyl-thioester dehydratase type 2 [Rhizoctonia solani 123E]